MIPNEDLTRIVTLLNVDIYEKLLQHSNFNADKTKFLVEGFRNGFNLQYKGTRQIKHLAPNLKLYCGDRHELWSKFVKEVNAKRFAGPFESPPFKNFIQSPIGLVPKGTNGTRLIFHLSYPRNGLSVNSETSQKFWSVKYKDLGVRQ